MWRKASLALLLLARLPDCTASCSYAGSDATHRNDDFPNDVTTHAELPWDSPGVLPGPVAMSNNAFISTGLAKTTPWSSVEGELLLETLRKFAATQDEEMCYWSYQANPPPANGPSPLHPYRKAWNVQDGHLDEDIEWGHALAEVAASRLHGLVEPQGPVVNAMCASGSELAKRRCANGRLNASKCIDAVVNQTLMWPMAVAIFKIGHPKLEATITKWRGRMHAPNIQWVYGAGSKATSPWNNNGSEPKPGDTNPPGMPQKSPWPSAKSGGWGLSPGLKMMAKVVPCSKIPARYMYPTEVFYCEHLAEGAAQTSSDESYDAWRTLTSLWPPTKQCVDDVAGLNKLLLFLALPLRIPPWHLPVKDCADAKSKLASDVPNFGCDTPNAPGMSFRDFCCSACGNQSLQVVPPKPPPAPKGQYSCKTCGHAYIPARDGDGKAFEDLPDDWVCPQCGAPKAAYKKDTGGDWVHAEQVIV